MRRHAFVGAALAGAIVTAWLILHIGCVFFLNVRAAGLIIDVLAVAALTWLNVGLFIVAHDAMHGSLFPGSPALNLAAGRVALGLYAAFSFDRLKVSHMAHHRSPGLADDPDFDDRHPSHFWPWYGTFLRRYFGVREFLILCIPVALYLLLGVRMGNLLLFWALPAALSSLQLFAFGTYLPHRHGERPFVDRHRARTNEFNWLLSLLTCFHFGYHHEHHVAPHVPWWALPRERKSRASIRSGRLP